MRDFIIVSEGVAAGCQPVPAPRWREGNQSGAGCDMSIFVFISMSIPIRGISVWDMFALDAFPSGARLGCCAITAALKEKLMMQRQKIRLRKRKSSREGALVKSLLGGSK